MNMDIGSAAPRQVWVIHGGTTFDNYEEYVAALRAKEVTMEKLLASDWKPALQGELGGGYRVVVPRMPNGNGARYAEWKIWLGKLAALMEDGAVLVGHSLGGIFLAKYLSEETLPVRIRATFLVAPPYDADGSDESLGDFALSGSLDGLARQGGRVTLYHSEDDPVVPFAQSAKYRAALPAMRMRTFRDRGHFNQETFPELAEDIRNS